MHAIENISWNKPAFTYCTDAKMLKYEIYVLKNLILLQQFSVDAVCAEIIPALIEAEEIFFH
jgi:hypothetical protein